jgi:hypothetical protein
VIVVHDGVKPCTRCGVFKSCTRDTFGTIKDKRLHKGWRWDSWCRLCRREATAQQRTRAEVREAGRAAARRYYERHRADPGFAERRRQTQREWQRRRMLSPEQRKRRNEDARINYRLRAERAGRSVRSLPIIDTTTGVRMRLRAELAA